MKLVLDFETVDKHLMTLGSGWAHGDMTVLGAALRREDWDESVYLRDKQDILDNLEGITTIICHNLQYDVGILKMWGVDISKYKLVDTMIIAKLINNVQNSYSLDNLSSKYLNKHKSDAPMALAAIRHRLYKVTKRKGPRSEKWKSDKMKGATKFAKTNMNLIDEVRPDLVEKYAKQDTDLTLELYNVLYKELEEKHWLEIVSDCYKVLIESRYRGVRIDVERVKEVRDILHEKELEALIGLKQYVPEESLEDFNPNSPKDLPAVLDRYKIKYPRTEKGNPSITAAWLDSFSEEECHPFLANLKLFRKYQKARRDFCDSVLDTQELIPENKRGRVYPEFRLFGAKTGRFSCSSPNCQAIPARDKEIGPLVRSMYLPEEGEKWYSLDFSSQESRIQVHYASLIDAEGSAQLVEEFKANPKLDLHGIVAELAGITRTEAKTINLGISYGMGVSKLAKSLGLTLQQAKVLIEQYHDSMPYLNTLNKKCMDTMQKRKYITTLGGRKSYIDSPIFDKEKQKMITFEYKALNKLSQGSASDQTIFAMVEMYKQGIPLIFSVHDQLCCSLKTREDAERVKEIMENCVELRVPMVTDIGEGTNWADAEEGTK